jgi:succinate dehydrogenase / fumarate reductase membrane anchor subunit
MAMTAAEKARSGTREWVLQRISNLMICVWGLIFILSILFMDNADFASWQAVFEPLWFKLLTSLVLVLAALNSVLAGWQIGTDYVKAPSVNRVYMAGCIAVTVLYFCAGIYIVWFL